MGVCHANDRRLQDECKRLRHEELWGEPNAPLEHYVIACGVDPGGCGKCDCHFDTPPKLRTLGCAARPGHEITVRAESLRLFS